MTTSGLTLFYALIGGFLPALFWLWFWLREDKLNPEPRGRIIMAFLGGMVAVLIVYPFEELVLNTVGHGGATVPTVIWWAIIEEVVKFVVCYVVAIRSRDYREPIDALEYLITTALGFAAVENTLFILGSLLHGDIMSGLVVSNMRFVGASLVHVVSSSALGYMIGREFYRRSWLPKSFALALGLVLASALHGIFNYFIIYKNGTNIFIVFGFVWAGAILLLILFENIKHLKAPPHKI